MPVQTTYEARATFMLVDAEEKPTPQATSRVTRARFQVAYEGDLKGSAVLVELHRTLPDGQMHIYGRERFTGSLHGRAGSFDMEHDGLFAYGKLVSTRTIVPGTGAGALAGLLGGYTFRSGQAEAFSLTLEYWFE